MSFCLENHEGAFQHLEIDLGGLERSWDLGYMFAQVTALGAQPPPRYWLELRISVRQLPATAELVCFARLHEPWQGFDDGTAEEKAALLEASREDLRALLMQLEAEGHVGLGEEPIFV
jgi:hypothetical protein